MASIDQISIVDFSDPVTVAELRQNANVPSHSGIDLIERGAEESAGVRAEDSVQDQAGNLSRQT